MRQADDAIELDVLLSGLHRRESAEQVGANRVEKSHRTGRASAEDLIMKFSRSIQFNAVPDWSSHYIAYSNLKKL
jgi:hypothetical protein